MINIQDLLNRFEAFKKKWLQLNEQDIHDWLDLCDDINDTIIELESMYLEEDALMDKDKWIRLIELKEEVWSDWKKSYTDALAKAKIDIEMYDRKIQQIYKKETCKRLTKKAELIEPYTNSVKLYLRRSFSI